MDSMRVLVVCLVLAGCASAAPQGPCTPQDPNEIDRWYQTEIAHRCALRGYNTENCPDQPDIEREYDRRYDDYARCGSK
jgi:hypothetical protein